MTEENNPNNNNQGGWFQRALSWLNGDTVKEDENIITSYVTLKEVGVKGRDPYSPYSLSYLETWMVVEAHNRTKRRNRKRWDLATGMNPNYYGDSWEKLENKQQNE